MNTIDRPKFSAGIWAFTPCTDRFAVMGYRDELTLEEKDRPGREDQGAGRAHPAVPRGGER